VSLPALPGTLVPAVTLAAAVHAVEGSFGDLDGGGFVDDPMLGEGLLEALSRVG